MATSTFKPPKPRELSENETITSFASWQSNILYHLSLNNEFARFLDDGVTWQKKSVANRGLAADAEPVPAADRKTAGQKKHSTRTNAWSDCFICTIVATQRHHR